ncbi:hypothetical protein H0H92_001438 [Tricholoma furcatifolium]|nr:hypothetical protein H0H92_001438 [Tricholoma furcatifolium]
MNSRGDTVRWQAPELFNSEEEEGVLNTPASDIYAWASGTIDLPSTFWARFKTKDNPTKPNANPIRIMTLAFQDMETKLEQVARDWSKLPQNLFSLRIPYEYASLKAAVTDEESYQLIITSVDSTRFEIIHDHPVEMWQQEDMAMDVDNTVLPESLPLSQQPSSPGLFGPRSPTSSRPSSPGLFGPRSPTSSRPSSPGLFGPRSPTSSRPSSPGLFGPRSPTSSRPSSPGLFGPRSPTSSRPSSPGLFGPRSPTSSRPSSPGLFGPRSLTSSRPPSPGLFQVDPRSHRSILTLAFGGTEIIKKELEEVAADRSKLPRNHLSLRVPVEYAALRAALSDDESYQLVIIGLRSISIEVVPVEMLQQENIKAMNPTSPYGGLFGPRTPTSSRPPSPDYASFKWFEPPSSSRPSPGLFGPVSPAPPRPHSPDPTSSSWGLFGPRTPTSSRPPSPDKCGFGPPSSSRSSPSLSGPVSPAPSRPHSPDPKSPMSLRFSSSHILDNRKTDELISKLAHIFATKEEYRRLLSCRGTSAQKILNMLQQLLDVMVNHWSTSIHRNVIAAAQRLAGASGLYPTCYDLDGVTDTGIYECSGGFADVFKADFRGQAVFSKEAILWSQLRHPNVLSFYGIYRIKDRISFVAPWMENGDISRFLKHNPGSNRVLLSIDVAHGLEFLHKNDIIHGDLKGGNILVNESGRACVADFGLSSISDKEILAWTSHSSVASKGGTVRWQAPELFDPEGEEDIHNTKASDIYAWAFVAYEIFTGEVPLAHISRDTTIVHKVLGGERPRRPPNSSLSWSAWGLTGDIWKLMETCWNPDPAQRPNVSVVIERLKWALPRNFQKDALAEAQTNGDSLSPGQFRKMARGEVDQNELSVETLERLLAHPK